MKLKRFELIAGGQFTGANGPIVVDFSKSQMIGAKADEEEGKTTLVQIMLLNAAMIGGEKVVSDLKNRSNGELKSKLVFQGDDRGEYEVTQDEGKLTVRREGETQPGGPQTLLKKLLGVVGISPMAIKDAPIEEIVKWLANYSTRGADEFNAEMLKIKSGIKTAKAGRAAANKSAKGLREYLAGEGYIDAKGQLVEVTWKASETKFKKKVDIKEVSARLEEAGAKSDKYIRAEQKLKMFKDNRPDQVKRIADLKKQLEAAEEALSETDKSITAAEKYLTDNKADKTNYDTVKKEFENISKDAVAYDKWQEVKKKKSEMDEFEDAAIKFDGAEKSLLKKQQDLQAEVIPDIRGVELVLEDTHEDEGEMKKAGYYYKGLNSRQLSASEWFGQVIQILKKNKIKFLIVDDISQFGSKFMELLTNLTKTGCYVFYTEMMRGQEEIILDYNLK